MLVLFLAVMSFHFLPKILHEVMGLLILLPIGIHLYQNRKFFLSFRKASWNRMWMLNAFLDVLLIACLLTAAGTGICMSNHLFKDMIPLELQRDIALHQHHVSLPYWMLVLMGLHAGLHWRSLKGRLGTVCSIPVLLILAVIGIYGSIQNRLGDRIMMKHIFATPAAELPGAEYVLLLLGIFALYVLVGIGLEKLLESSRKK